MSFRLGARQFFERRGAPTPPLPYDAEVEWIRSDGSSFIQLPDVEGWTGKQFLELRGRFACDFTVSAAHALQTVFAISNNKALRVLSTNTSGGLPNSVQLLFPMAKSIPASEVPNLSRITVEYVVEDSGVRYLLDGSEYYSNTWDNIATTQKTGKVVPMRLLADGAIDSEGQAWTRTTRFCVSSMLHSMRYYSGDGNSVFDLIPVRKDGVGYMYDRVSGSLFGNGGTGDLVIGPDKS